MSETRETAPFRHDLAEGPESGYALWRKTSDGKRLRIGIWPAKNAAGTILLFNGRTEYIEKYGRLAVDLTAAGYNVITPDWRGQGLSERLTNDPMQGYIGTFSEYQHDVAELLATVRDEGMEEPLYLLAHSMGGGIGMRSLLEGLPVRRAVFSAPMWGIFVSPLLRRIMPPVVRTAVWIGLGRLYVPGVRNKTYVLETSFEDNTLTHDQEYWEYFQRHANEEPGLRLGGASLQWAMQAYDEAADLRAGPRPEIPVLTFVGTKEEIVDPDQIASVHVDWPTAELVRVEGSKHEGLMELPSARDEVVSRTINFFDADRA